MFIAVNRTCRPCDHAGMVLSLPGIRTTVSSRLYMIPTCAIGDILRFADTFAVMAVNMISHDRYPRLWCREETSGQPRDPCWQGDIQVILFSIRSLKDTHYESLRDEFRRMLQSIVANGHTFEQCKEHLKKSNSFLHTGLCASLNHMFCF